jgi:MATE family multidrug resistance protein
MQDGQAAAARGHAPGAAPRAAGHRRHAAAGGIRRLRRVRREARRILRLAGPIVLSQLGVVGMTTTDTLMVGPLGPTALAAVGVGGAIHFFALVMSMGLVLGTGPLVSQAFGAGRLRDCRLLLVQGVWVALVASVPVMLVSAEGERIARLLGQAPEIAGLAGAYTRALAPGVPGWLLFMAFRQYVEGIGRPTPPTVITLFGLVLNALANHAFIYGVGGVIPAMGAVGTGWATTLVRWSMAFAAAAYLAFRADSAPVRGVGVLAPRPALVRRILAVGAPISGQLVLEVGLFSFGAAIMMGWLGAVPLAAHQIAINLASTTFMVALGASLAGQIRVGHHIGARRPAATRRAALATYMLAVGFMAACGLVFLGFPTLLVGLYTGEPDVLRLGATLLLFAAAFQVFDGAQVAGLCVLRGAADTAVPMLAAGLGYWGVGLPAAYLLGFHTPLGAAGIWAGLSLALAVVAALLALRVRHVLWRRAPAPPQPGAAAVGRGDEGQEGERRPALRADPAERLPGPAPSAQPHATREDAWSAPC